MRKNNGVLFPIIFSSIFVLTACGGGGGLTDADVADTDGDGYSDYEEIINKNFDASNNNYKFNHLLLMCQNSMSRSAQPISR